MNIFDGYILHPECRTIRKTLLWDYDLSVFDWEKGKSIVVERVIERGDLQDWYALFNMYGGKKGVRDIVRQVHHISDRDIEFVCVMLDLKKDDLRCYTRKQSREKLLNY